MRSRSVLVLVFTFVAGLTSACWGPTAALAQETGGLPAVDARVKVLEGLVAAQQSALTALRNDVTGLQTANTALQNALNQEAAARGAADADLQAAVNAERASRIAGDGALQSALNQEAAARAAADQQLQASISSSGPRVFATLTVNTNLVNGVGTVGQLGPLPAGNYVVVAKANVNNPDHTVQWLCELLLDNNTILDSTDTHTHNHGALDSRAISLGHDVNVAAFTLASSSSVRMTCSTGEANSFLSNIQIVAIKVGDITRNP